MNWLYYAMMGHIELYLLYNSVFYWPYCTMMNSIILHHMILYNKVSYCTVYCHFEQWYLCIFLCLVGGAGCTIWPLFFSSTFRKSRRARQQQSQRILQYLVGKEGYLDTLNSKIHKYFQLWKKDEKMIHNPIGGTRKGKGVQLYKKCH